MVSRRWAGAALAAVVTWWLPTSASAQAEPIRLTYRAYTGCPAETQFVDDVMRRTDRARRVPEGTAVRSFDVALQPDGGKSRGTLRITTPTGKENLRELAGDGCPDVASALALITALAIDPDARTGNPSPDPPADVTAPQPLPEKDAPSSPPEATPGAVASLPATDPEVWRDAHPATPPQQWPVSLGATGQAMAGLVPGTGIGGSVFVDVSRDQPGPLAAAFRWSLVVAETTVAFTPAISTSLAWFLARLEACPLRVPVEPSVAMRLCATADLGVLRSDASGLAHVGSETRPWFAPGALARLAWTIPDSGGAWIEGSVGAAVPLPRYTFSYQRGGTSDTVDVAQVAAAGETFGVGAGYRFP